MKSLFFYFLSLILCSAYIACRGSLSSQESALHEWYRPRFEKERTKFELHWVDTVITRWSENVHWQSDSTRIVSSFDLELTLAQFVYFFQSHPQLSVSDSIHFDSPSVYMLSGQMADGSWINTPFRVRQENYQFPDHWKDSLTQMATNSFISFQFGDEVYHARIIVKLTGQQLPFHGILVDRKKVSWQSGYISFSKEDWHKHRVSFWQNNEEIQEMNFYGMLQDQIKDLPNPFDERELPKLKGIIVQYLSNGTCEHGLIDFRKINSKSLKVSIPKLELLTYAANCTDLRLDHLPIGIDLLEMPIQWKWGNLYTENFENNEFDRISLVDSEIFDKESFHEMLHSKPQLAIHDEANFDYVQIEIEHIAQSALPTKYQLNYSFPELELISPQPLLAAIQGSVENGDIVKFTVTGQPAHHLLSYVTLNISQKPHRNDWLTSRM